MDVLRNNYELQNGYAPGALQIAYGDYGSTFEELIKKDGTATIQQRNLTTLAIEIYNISNDFSQIFMTDMLTESRNPCNTNLMLNWKKTHETWDVPKNYIFSSQ